MLITIVLLLTWLEPPAFRFGIRWDVVDMFAGAGRIARLGRRSGLRTVALDREYSENPHSFDINESAGFLCLALWVMALGQETFRVGVALIHDVH